MNAPIHMKPEDFDALLAALDQQRADRAVQMPTTEAALDVLFTAWLRLKELGWREAMYCPKDGTVFEAIEAGSTGVHKCHYSGEWPTGHWWLHDDAARDLWPSHPILFRKINGGGQP